MRGPLGRAVRKYEDGPIPTLQVTLPVVTASARGLYTYGYLVGTLRWLVPAARGAQGSAHDETRPCRGPVVLHRLVCRGDARRGSWRQRPARPDHRGRRGRPRGRGPVPAHLA